MICSDSMSAHKIGFWLRWSTPELLVFEDAHGHAIIVVVGLHERVCGGEQAPVHSFAVQEVDLVDSSQDDLDIISAHVLCRNS